MWWFFQKEDKTSLLIKRLVAVGIFVVFISSNAVFDGTIPFVRADQPVNPKTAYGRQKAAAEEALFAALVHKPPISRV